MIMASTFFGNENEQNFFDFIWNKKWKLIHKLVYWERKPSPKGYNTTTKMAASKGLKISKLKVTQRL